MSRDTLNKAKRKENGELEQYRESMNLCDECGTFISRSIAENFNNNYLDVKKVTAEAAGKYGFERAMLMLALRIDSLKYAGLLCDLVQRRPQRWNFHGMGTLFHL